MIDNLYFELLFIQPKYSLLQLYRRASLFLVRSLFDHSQINGWSSLNQSGVKDPYFLAGAEWTVTSCIMLYWFRNRSSWRWNVQRFSHIFFLRRNYIALRVIKTFISVQNWWQIQILPRVVRSHRKFVWGIQIITILVIIYWHIMLSVLFDPILLEIYEHLWGRDSLINFKSILYNALIWLFWHRLFP